jgi:hypothetical protein
VLGKPSIKHSISGSDGMLLIWISTNHINAIDSWELQLDGHTHHVHGWFGVAVV